MSTVDALLKYFNTNKGVGESAMNALSGLTVGQNAYDSIGSNNDALNAQIQYLSDMYNPNGVVAQQMQQAIAAKDARAGRNSQYAQRSATLQAQLAQGASTNAARIAQLMQQKQQSEVQQQQIRAGQLGSLFDLAKKSGAVDWGMGQLKDIFGTKQPAYNYDANAGQDFNGYQSNSGMGQMYGPTEQTYSGPMSMDWDGSGATAPQYPTDNSELGWLDQQ
jgi:hypothetical protein